MASETYPLRLDDKLLQAVRKQAAAEHRNLAGMIRHMIACYLLDRKAGTK